MMQHDDLEWQLVPQHAFVVQFTADTRIETGPVAGRVEHIVSRQSARFTSLETLLDFITRTLIDIRNPASRDAGLHGERDDEVGR